MTVVVEFPRAIPAPLRTGTQDRAEAFWEPGGDVIHYQNGNNRADIPVRYTVTMLGEPGKPMLTVVDEDELARRASRRAPARAPLGSVSNQVG
jgi:hypothetical protein